MNKKSNFNFIKRLIGLDGNSAISLLCVACLSMVTFSAWAEYTIAQSIKQVLYNASADYQFFTGTSGWGAPSCNSYYVQITNGVPNRDKLLAIVLTAYAAGKKVQFQGT